MNISPKLSPSVNSVSYFRLQLTVFALVAASFTNIYITQPLLPVLQAEFATSMVLISTSVSAVIFGIVLTNLPFGALADRVRIQPIILGGGVMVALGGVICALTDNLGVFIGARLMQGLFIPALTTCLAAYLAKTLPLDRLNVVMGSYVSATVCGGLGGRLLGGWVDRFFNWRYALLVAAGLILITVITALLNLPREAVKKINYSGTNNLFFEITYPPRSASYLRLCGWKFCHLLFTFQLSAISLRCGPV